MDAPVLVIDDDVDLGACLVDMFESLLNLRCRHFVNLAALQQEPAVLPHTRLAIIDVNLGAANPSGIEAYQWMKDNGFLGQAVFLTGHAHDHPLMIKARQLGDIPVYAKPLDLDEILGLGRKL